MWFITGDVLGAGGHFIFTHVLFIFKFSGGAEKEEGQKRRETDRDRETETPLSQTYALRL